MRVRRYRPKPLRPALVAWAIVASLQADPAWAVEPFALEDIRVEGLQRGDAGAVFAALPFRVGDTYTDEKGAAALRALFATGLFKDVRIDIDGRQIVVVVEERPIIAGVSFVGMKEFEQDVIVKSLKESGIGEGLPFDMALIDRAEQEIKRQYLSRSLYGAEVVTTVTPVERNRVNVTFTMTEGEAARIREIHIVGNTAFSESSLLGLFEQAPTGFFSWYTKSDRYSRSKLNADLETLRAHYLNRGYLEFSVENTQVTISPDKQQITITIAVVEGQPYTVTEVRLEGNYLGRDDDFKSLVAIRPGQPYRAEDVAATTREFGERFGVYGYAFARIDPRTDIDRQTGQVVVTLVADPLRRVYVRRIGVAGNSRTRDEVVRREFRQFESSWYDGQRIKLSRDRLNRLGFFKKVEIETNEVAGATDQVDLVVNVEEQPTGNILVGAGFSSAEKLALTLSVKQDNAFGTGNSLGVELNTSRTSRTAVLSTVDPYFTDNGISRALDIFYRTSRPLNRQGADYKLVTPGASIRFGVPFSEVDTVFFGIGVERTEIRGTTGLPNNFFLFRERFGAATNSIPLTIGWARDDRDSALAPTSGRFQRINVELSPAGNAQFVRTSLQYQQFVPITNRFTLSGNAEFGWGTGLGGKPFPVFKNFFGGGLGTVRGYEPGSLGPVDVTGAFTGGNKRANVNVELLAPFPGAGNDRTLRMFGFFDAGNVWGDSEKANLSTLRASTGFGLSWTSPVGPLKLSWGIPLRERAGDRIQQFQFQIGTAF